MNEQDRLRLRDRWASSVAGALRLPALIVAIGLSQVACGTATVGGGGQDDPARQTPRVMVTLPATSKFLVRRSVEELVEQYQLRFVAAWKMRSLGVQCVVFEIPRRVDQDVLVRGLENDHRVDMAQVVSQFNVQGSQASRQTAEERSYRRFQRAADVLRLDQAHLLATGRGVRVAVVDTGADLGHQEYGSRVAVARNFVADQPESFVRDAHGTAVAGLIAADHRDGSGMLGVAPEAELQILKACWPEPEGGRRAVCDSYTLALALDFAVAEAAQVINLSLAGPEEPILRRLIEEAIDRGVVVVAAWPTRPPRFPASLHGVIAVRALTASTEGFVDTGGGENSLAALAAPGEEVLATVPGGGYDFWSGSSMASAQVAGVAALILEHRPEITSGEILELLRETARDNPGQAVVDACAALAKLTGGNCT